MSNPQELRMFRSLLVSLSLLAAASAHAADGLILFKSPHAPKATMDRFESVVSGKGMTVFARIDHAAGAAKVGQALRPTEVIVFGNPQGGTPFMQCAQSVGIDLPLKVLVWADADGQTWLGYNDPVWLAARHAAGDCPVVPRIAAALSAFAGAATAP
jgi:uncharacterized protein (DUF302 family)